LIKLMTGVNVYQGQVAEPARPDPRCMSMCAAHDEIDEIHLAEVAAQKRIEEAERRAKEIKEEAEAESQKILENAAAAAKENTKAITSETEAKKKDIDRRVQDETDRRVAHLETTAKEHMKDAVKIAVKIILAEE